MASDKPTAWMIVQPGCVVGQVETMESTALQKARECPPGTAVVPLYTRPEAEDIDRLLRAAYYRGFAASGEGYNGEYPFGDMGREPTDEPDWVARRDASLKELRPQPQSSEDTK